MSLIPEPLRFPSLPETRWSQQENSFDCGIFVCLFVTNYCLGNNFWNSESSEDYRAMMKRTIRNKSIDFSGLWFGCLLERDSKTFHFTLVDFTEVHPVLKGMPQLSPPHLLYRRRRRRRRGRSSSSSSRIRRGRKRRRRRRRKRRKRRRRIRKRSSSSRIRRGRRRGRGRGRLATTQRSNVRPRWPDREARGSEVTTTPTTPTARLLLLLRLLQRRPEGHPGEDTKTLRRRKDGGPAS